MKPDRRARRQPDRIAAIIGTVLAIGGCGLIGAAGVAALEGDTTPGQVAISDQVNDRPLFTVTGLAPGDQVERCWQITGHGQPNVRLWAQAQGTLAPYLRVAISAGRTTGNPADTGCSSYTPRTELGDAVLTDIPTSPETAITDPAAFADGERRAYRLRVTVAPNAPEQQRATASFHACAQAPGATACDPVTVTGATGGPSSPPNSTGRQCTVPTLADGLAKKIRKGRYVQRRVGAGRARMTTLVTGPYGRRTIRVNVTASRLAVRSVAFRVNRRPLTTDSRRPYTVNVPNSKLRAGRNEIKAHVRLQNGKTITLRWGFRLSKPASPKCQ